MGVFSIADLDSQLSLRKQRGQDVVWVRILHVPVDDSSCPNLLLLPGFGARRSHGGPRYGHGRDRLLGQYGSNQLVWYTYSPQYYQSSYATQTPQTYYTPQYSPQRIRPKQLKHRILLKLHNRLHTRGHPRRP